MSILPRIAVLLMVLLCLGCQVTETIYVRQDGTGNINLEILRMEQSYQQLVGERYNENEVFKDTTYVFDDYITKYNDTFSKLSPEDKAVFDAYKGVQVHIKRNPYEKEFRTIYKQNFDRASQIADLYKTQEYVSDIVHNYALSADEHYYKVAYQFDQNKFRRVVTIIDTERLKKEQEEIIRVKKKIAGQKVHQKLTLKYFFPKKIQTVSIPNAKISADKQAVEITFNLIDALMNPESTSVTIQFEP